MTKNLVVVESPAKARTIARILGREYVVKASLGHVRDLPQGELAVQVDNEFKPTYETLRNKAKVVRELKEAAKEAPVVYLATDPDREGEAIAWHLVQVIKLKPDQVQRVVFHQITEPAVQQAFQHPRGIDMRLVNAQQARRILDRLVGYKLSPFLWRKVQKGLSAGRVQSVALRLVAEREQEIEAFVPQESWTIEAQLQKAQDGASPPVVAVLWGLQGQRKQLHIPDQQAAGEHLRRLEGARYSVEGVQGKELRQRPAPPFTTSTLQQEAWRKLRFTAQRTMLLAQQLYEGLPIGDEGSVGLITYMRTDSTQVAPEALREAQAYIRKRFGQEFTPPSPRMYTRKAAGAQEAHEAIRPTQVHRDPESVKPHLTPEQLRLYDLIWKRMVASQMADARVLSTQVTVLAQPPGPEKPYLFRATGTQLLFPGFRALYMEGRDDGAEEDRSPLPSLSSGELLHCLALEAKQHFTQPPQRYTEATLIRALEEKGIGRPSTYAPIIATILERGYVARRSGRFHPQPLGKAANALLTHHFSSIIDVGFTAQMEQRLDEIAQGERDWVPVLRDFYHPFEAMLQEAMVKAQRVKVEAPTDQHCPTCGRPMVVKWGRFGPFLSCSDFPRCRAKLPYQEPVGVQCPQCGGDLVQRRSGKGRVFYGCINYPSCNFATSRRPLPQPCPQCGGLLVAQGEDRARCTACPFRGPVPEQEREPAEAAV